VVGRRGLNSVLATLLGSVSQSLVAHAPVPVVVVPETWLPTDAPGPVVVGVARAVLAPIALAFMEAEMRGAPLLAIRGWTLPSPYIVASREATASLDAAEDAELEALLADHRTLHPSVPVTTRVTSSAPEEALLDAATEAALIVLGRHRRHHRYGLPLGTVPHRVLHRAAAPVAVVPN
jgi:nucleotide-binding universal stress UspA family protein